MRNEDGVSGALPDTVAARVELAARAVDDVLLPGLGDELVPGLKVDDDGVHLAVLVTTRARGLAVASAARDALRAAGFWAFTTYDPIALSDGHGGYRVWIVVQLRADPQ